MINRGDSTIAALALLGIVAAVLAVSPSLESLGPTFIFGIAGALTVTVPSVTLGLAVGCVLASAAAMKQLGADVGESGLGTLEAVSHPSALLLGATLALTILALLVLYDQTRSGLPA